MKTFFLIIIVAFVLGSCKEKPAVEDKLKPSLLENLTKPGLQKGGPKPEFNFEFQSHDFGKVTQGEKVVYTFVFTNSGKADLLITDAIVSCGCTVPKYTKIPVKPGEKGKVEVMFNTAGKKGAQFKTIQLFANTDPNTYELRIKAQVEDAK